MKVYLAGIAGARQWLTDGTIRPEDMFALESFYSMQEWQKPLLSRFKSFLLDSGAFTFMNNATKHGNVDWLSYADKYADFIKAYGIRHYFELDIDSVKGLKYAEMLRSRIESRCGVQSIPVWHISRGKDYLLGMAKDYKYIAIGGIVTKEIKPAWYDRLFPWAISVAHKNGAKIHGLGYTSQTKIFPFDSIDSTTWTNGQRFGEAHRFEKGKIVRHGSVINGVKTKALKDTKQCALFNLKEWLKYQRFAEVNL